MDNALNRIKNKDFELLDILECAQKTKNLLCYIWEETKAKSEIPGGQFYRGFLYLVVPLASLGSWLLMYCFSEIFYVKTMIVFFNYACDVFPVFVVIDLFYVLSKIILVFYRKHRIDALNIKPKIEINASPAKIKNALCHFGPCTIRQVVELSLLKKILRKTMYLPTFGVACLCVMLEEWVTACVIVAAVALIMLLDSGSKKIIAENFDWLKNNTTGLTEFLGVEEWLKSKAKVN